MSKYDKGKQPSLVETEKHAAPQMSTIWNGCDMLNLSAEMYAEKE